MKDSMLDRLTDLCALVALLPDGLFQSVITASVHTFATAHNQDEIELMKEMTKVMEEIRAEGYGTMEVEIDV